MGEKICCQSAIFCCYRSSCDIDDLSHTRAICFLRVWFNILRARGLLFVTRASDVVFQIFYIE